MILRQFLHTDPVGISYVFGCGSKGICVVCDPIEDPGRYLTASKETGMKIRYVIDTHVHADHLSGGRKLASLAGASYVFHASVQTACPSLLASVSDIAQPAWRARSWRGWLQTGSGWRGPSM